MAKIVITGASGVLGSAIYRALKTTNHAVIGLANSRAQGGLSKIDLTDQSAIQDFLRESKPDWVIHCAAERRPDVAEKDPDGAQRLNAEVPGHLASLAKDLGFTLIYISTDYVFDGTAPPYGPASQTNPLQLYGKSKRDGENAVSSVAGAKIAILRVPVLYGPAPHNSDSAVNILLDIVQDQSGKQYKMDHYATRSEQAAAFNNSIIAGTNPSRNMRYSNPPTGPGATSRPKDCHLSTKETEDLDIPGGLGLSLFEEWWAVHLGKQ
ncbi:hypothetical protein NP233_g4595 [Leucocoprinus birnbaumii]|uniref:RmlD-like substrate binding domain-containing protein n=1 Tax=Leucocoprinus birnbaumii TaxID=56174 RepID=A0AAD5VY28_9AGAR|nr:hypothetical protein NP233_g4595 [Leucocoprinus birnbaumii]